MNEFYRHTEQGTVRIPYPEEEFVKKLMMDIAFHQQKVKELTTILEDVALLKEQGEELTYRYGRNGYGYERKGTGQEQGT